MSPQWKRRLGIGSVAVAAVVVVPTIAFALPYIDLPFEATFTGCLKPNGEINKVAQGADPKQPCNDTDQEIHLSGGDITAVTASTGLSGGSQTGPASLSIAPAYRLPQNCGDGAVARKSGSTWTCSTDFGGIHTSTIGLGDVVAAGPTEDCIDGSTFTGQTAVTANTKNLTFVLPAGKWRPATAGNTRWFMNKTSDLFDGETFAKGHVVLEIVKNQNNVDTVVSTWARAEAENMDGGGLPYNQDFKSFQADGSAKFFLRATAVGGACTTARVLSPTIEFERVG
jgi:hypothetical protein